MSLAEYLQSYKNYFWQYEEEGEVLAVPSCSTIAYKDHILDIIEHLAPQGLPPFGSLLLAVIATNASSDGPIDAVYNILGARLKDLDKEYWNNTYHFMKLLAEVPGTYKEGDKRVLLLQTIFESCHNILSIKQSKGIVNVYRGLHNSLSGVLNKADFNQAVFSKELKVFGLLANKFPTVASILAKMATLPFVEKEPLEITESIPEIHTDKDLVQQLIENNKTFYIGSLIKRIWSGLNIPFHNYLPSQQPIGGISDFTNKGDLDKLLISEFANDDLLFLSRLANREALYINREIPPASNDIHRIILIDVSLRNWGTPRLMALALILAISKHPKTTISCSAYAIGQSYRPVPMNNINDIIDSLQLLDGTLHCADGLDAYFREYPPDANAEIFLISSSDSIRLTAMQKALSDHHSNFNYQIHTDAEGGISVFRRQYNSRKHVQTIRLPLTELWKKESPTAVPAIDPPQHIKTDSWPRYPILFRSPLKIKRILRTSDGRLFQVTGENCLLQFYDRSATRYSRGWKMVYENLPAHATYYEIGLSDTGDYIFLMFSTKTKEITLINISDRTQISTPIKDWISSPFNQFIFYANKFYYLTNTHSWAIDLHGNIIKEDISSAELHSRYNDRQNELRSIADKTSDYQTTLKKIRRVSINKLNNLVFNTHELSIENDSATLSHCINTTAVNEAARLYGSNFEFPDGSSIIISRSGLLTLRSSDKKIPVIYISSILDSRLGMAVNDAFAGNIYYYKEADVDLRLDDTGGSRLSVVKVLKDFRNIGLKEATDLTHDTPRMIAKNITQSNALDIKKQIEDAGGTATLIYHEPYKGRRESQKITIREFFDRYINPFISTIRDYGTKN